VRGVHDLTVDGTHVTCQLEPSALDEVLRAFTQVGIRNIVTQPPTLEELFLRFYGDAAS
jgi:ABC-2 type transport system ATP-binding protein